MRILYITPTLPVPTSGGRTRVFNLVKHLSAKHEITVLSFLQPSDEEWLPLLEPYCSHLELVPFAGFKSYGKWINRLVGWQRILFSRRPRYVHTFPVASMRVPFRALLSQYDFDIVVFETLYLVELVDEVDDLPTLLVEQNVESDVQRRYIELAANPVHRWRDKLMWRKLLDFETIYLDKFLTVVAVSEQDADLLRALCPSAQLFVVPNGVDSQIFRPPEEVFREENKLLFFGTLNYTPNVEGIKWFVQNVFPHIQSSCHNISLEIVGINPVTEVENLAQRSGVTVVGFVPDVREKVWSATLCVVPLLTGGGTRLKILESLAAGCPVVSTTIGAEGLDLIDGEHLLLADTPEAFAECVVDLLDSPKFRQSLARQGQHVVANKYDWSMIGKQFEEALTKAVKEWHCGLSV